MIEKSEAFITNSSTHNSTYFEHFYRALTPCVHSVTETYLWHCLHGKVQHFDPGGLSTSDKLQSRNTEICLPDQIPCNFFQDTVVHMCTSMSVFWQHAINIDYLHTRKIPIINTLVFQHTHTHTHVFEWNVFKCRFRSV